MSHRNRHDVAVAVAATLTVAQYLEHEHAPETIISVISAMAEMIASEMGVASAEGKNGTMTVRFSDGETETVDVEEIHRGGRNLLMHIVAPLAARVGWDPGMPVPASASN